MKFHKFSEKAFPYYSRRGKLYDLGLKSGRILINEGPNSFFTAVKRYQYDQKHINNLGQIKSKVEETFTISPSEFLPINDIKIAVHVHVYYIDLFDEIVRYLKNIPINFSLYITVTSYENKKIIENSIEKIPNVENAEVRVVDNRGRDIAPFVTEFGSLLKNFDYICHIHTKKSVYTGEEKNGWRQYLFDRLLGSEDVIHAILTAFKKDTSIGIIYPEIYPHLPYWACTWLSNKHMAQAILNKLKIRFDRDEYFDYPVGSMFWIRKESFEPVLKLNLKLDDFPEELGQTDGTLQHTLERCFGIAAENQGFNHLVIRDPNTYLFSYRSNRNLHQYIAASFEDNFTRGLELSDVVSFDIFDTLLIRPFANPDKVFDYLEEIISKKYGIERYKKFRIEAESIARARKNYLGDVKISEIYLIFSEIAKINPITADELLHLEVNTEKKLLTPRKELIESAKYAKNIGKRVILVSDTYMERKCIEDILSSKDMDFFDEIYLSCEIGKRKDRGDLWDYVFESEGINLSNFMHIGDNEESDIQRISDRGFKNLIHIMRPSLFFRQVNLGLKLWNELMPYSGWRENLLYGKIANRLCSNPNEKELLYSGNPFENPFNTGYIVFGPIIFDFMNWLIKESKKDMCQQLWFTAREGYLLNNILEMMRSHPSLHEIKENIPKNCYFLCSRRTAAFASIKTIEDIPLLMGGNFKGTLRDFFVKRLITQNIAAIEDRLGSALLDRQITLVNDYSHIYDSIKQVIEILAEEAESEKQLLIEYCNTQGFDRSSKISIVDLGYSGTMQYALSKILDYPLNGYYFITTQKASKLHSLGSGCKAYFGEYVSFNNNKIPLYKYSLLLESVLTSPAGQLIRFDRDTLYGLSPVFKEQGLSQREFNRISEIHAGILTFISEMINEFGLSVFEIEFPKDLVQICYELVIKGEINIGSLNSILSVEDDYSGNDELSPLEFYRRDQSLTA